MYRAIAWFVLVALVVVGLLGCLVGCAKGSKDASGRVIDAPADATPPAMPAQTGAAKAETPMKKGRK